MIEKSFDSTSLQAFVDNSRNKSTIPLNIFVFDLLPCM